MEAQYGAVNRERESMIEEINYKYQLFNARILFFVLINCLWLVINNFFFVGEWTLLSYLFFGIGLLTIDYIIFPRLIYIFKRDGKIILTENEIIFRNLKTEKKIKLQNINYITYYTMSTMNVKFGVLTIGLKERKDIKIFFEDINNDNEEFYISIYKRIKNNKIVDKKNVNSNS